MELAVASPQFRVILLRRLRLALPVAPRACACRGRLDPLGDRRAACANAGVLASRALPPERAVARVCQEAGARVAQARRSLGLTPGRAKPPAATDAKRTPSSCAPVAAAWWSLVLKPEAGSVPKLPRGYACLRARASAAPAAMQSAARSVWVARWSGLLAVAAHSAFAASLLELPLAGECNLEGEAPELHEVLADVRWQLPIPASRLGPR